jgi:flagellar basal-body rod protein FlgB
MICGMFDSGALPALTRLVQFTHVRHQVLTHNIANLSTPYFKSRQLDPRGFQASLASAIDRRRTTPNPIRDPLEIRDTRTFQFKPGGIDAKPQSANDNVLLHDQNNHDLERTMQRLAENTMANNAALEMIRNQLGMLRLAIREQV